MKNRMIALGIISILIVAVTFVGFTVLQGQKREPERVTRLPQIVSKLARLELVSAKVENEGKPDAFAALEIRNKSNKSIIAVVVESGSDKERAGTTLNGFNDGDEPPTVIAEPNDTVRAEMPLANLRPGFPIRISGVMYADGTQEGEATALETMNGQKEHYKAIRKGEPKQ